jgi:hypothetical protein
MKQAMADPTIRVPNWEKFQHYKTRTPPWIKLYRDILNKPEWFKLSGDACKLLAECWLLASEDQYGEIHLSTDDLTWRLRRTDADHTRRTLQELAALEFLDISDHDASAMLAPCRQDAIPETEGETETEAEKEQMTRPGASAALVPVEPVQGEWSHDPQAPLATQELIGAWIKHYEKRNGRRPPGKDIPKQGAVAKRICDGHTAEEVVYAFLGIDHLFPYSKGEPWDLFDLEKKFTKAMAAAQDHPDIKRQREEEAFMEAIGHREAA